MNVKVNPFTGLPYSSQYYELLEQRKKLPVWEMKDKFMELIANNQMMIIQGDTGSGKTTQV